MSVEDQVIRQTLQTDVPQKMGETVVAINAAKDATEDLASGQVRARDELGRFVSSTSTAAAGVSGLASAADQATATVHTATDAWEDYAAAVVKGGGIHDKAAGSLGELDEGMGRATRSTGNFGRATLESGRILQDFAQGG